MVKIWDKKERHKCEKEKYIVESILLKAVKETFCLEDKFYSAKYSNC